MKTTECPECEKLALVQENAQALSHFVDWLPSQGYAICESTSSENNPWALMRKPYEQLFADYFGIDLNKVEVERRALLEEIREGK